ncbi:hypothetical protein [Serinicoccus hydrothermalis]|uniref:hypothetical protein n=1 Tax=Serinicoccus hydrothermalis TaxID=1758689 RepID=UPI00082BBABE|nr:hypothetical protein [Serinicoccus hydrothermalis]
MGSKREVFMLARIPVLLILLLAMGSVAEAKMSALAMISMEDYWGPWAISLVLSLVFVVVALIGRRLPHRWLVLAVEAVVAAVIAIVPPIAWVLWLGIGGSWVTAMTYGDAQPLAITWLTIVGFRAFYQLRDHPTSREQHRRTSTNSVPSDAR